MVQPVCGLQVGQPLGVLYHRKTHVLHLQNEEEKTNNFYYIVLTAEEFRPVLGNQKPHKAADFIAAPKLEPIFFSRSEQRAGVSLFRQEKEEKPCSCITVSMNSKQFIKTSKKVL